EKEAKQIIDLKRNLFKIDVRAQKDEEKVFMRTACRNCDNVSSTTYIFGIIEIGFIPIFCVYKTQ
ncbi:hypothetical protein, partial [Streptococcus agalactiae]|uniref:hypothetical protein n=3 Tax=Streptococcus agalactiae TaxID=1311 RepID=UPI001A9C3926